jgi:hypothetical protein
MRRSFDFGAGEAPSLGVVWGDVATAYYTTGIPDIEVYFEATPLLELILGFGRMFGPALRSAPAQAWLKAHSALLPAGPSDAQRASHDMAFVAEARDDDGGICAGSARRGVHAHRLRIGRAGRRVWVTGARLQCRASTGRISRFRFARTLGDVAMDSRG